MVSQDAVRLTTHARLLPDPPLWCWEIVDADSGVVVASSWQSEWKAYPSSDEALRDAMPALLAMTRGSRLARPAPRPSPPPELVRPSGVGRGR